MIEIGQKVGEVAGCAELEHMEWSDRLQIGVPLIDEQHKRFFYLAASLRAEGEEVRVMRTLALLSDYVRNHFRDEEALMVACHYPEIEGHRRAHQEFRDLLAALLESARKMTLDQIADEVRRLVNGWFYRHIMTVDVKYVAHVRIAEAGALAGTTTPYTL